MKVSMEGFELLGQGAEARLYKGQYLGKMALVKERFEKKYRHPDLDARLTKDRIRAEARAIVRAKAAGSLFPVSVYVLFDVSACEAKLSANLKIISANLLKIVFFKIYNRNL